MSVAVLGSVNRTQYTDIQEVEQESKESKVIPSKFKSNLGSMRPSLRKKEKEDTCCGMVFLYAVNMYCYHWLINKATWPTER